MPDDIEAVIGRDSHRPELLKPSPPSLFRALKELDLPPTSVVFVGDSTGDIPAGLPVIGYANEPGKEVRLRD